MNDMKRRTPLDWLAMRMREAVSPAFWHFMHKRRCPFGARSVLWIASFGFLALQAKAQANVATSSANSAWASLTAAQPSAGSGATPAQLAAQLIQTAAAAHAFYTGYPSDARAAAAQKIEALSTLEAAEIDPTDYKSSAVTLATAFRNNTSLAVSDRIDVAFVCDTMLLPLGGKTLVEDGPAYAALVDNLYTEFGPQDRVFNLYVGVMESVDEKTALSVANELVSLNAPSFALTPAQSVIARSALIGKPLKLSIITYGGHPLNLATPVGEPTVLYFWSNANGLSHLATFNQCTAPISSGMRVIYVCLQADMSAVAAAEAQVPLPGIFCFQQSGMDTSDEASLGLLQLPYAYVLDKNGNMAGYGRPQDLPAIFATLNP